MSKATVDRFEDAWAVLIIDGAERILPRDRLPEGTREGDVIDLSTGELDAAEREALAERVRAARAKNAPPGSGGSFDL